MTDVGNSSLQCGGNQIDGIGYSRTRNERTSRTTSMGKTKQLERSYSEGVRESEDIGRNIETDGYQVLSTAKEASAMLVSLQRTL
jgi:hypothetical protein